MTSVAMTESWPLEQLVKQYDAGMKMVDRMSRQYPHALMHELIYMPRLTASQCQDQDTVVELTGNETRGLSLFLRSLDSGC